MINTTAQFNDSTIRSSAYTKNGRYVLGGTITVGARGFGWWEKNDVQPDISDTLYALEERYVGRPDLLAYAFYGSTTYWWVIPQFNGILDPEVELVQGKLLIIPSLAKLDSTFRENNKLGGITA